jgi:hypothetical protein
MPLTTNDTNLHESIPKLSTTESTCYYLTPAPLLRERGETYGNEKIPVHKMLKSLSSRERDLG